MSDVVVLFEFIGSVMGVIFTLLDSVYFYDYSILDYFVAFLYLDITIWFIFAVFNHKEVSTDGN